MRKIIAYLATSVDGFIARPDGDVTWLDRPDPADGYGMPAFLQSVDTLVMGRKTWEVGQQLGGAAVEGKRNIILSRTMPFHAAPGATVENIEAADLAARLRSEKGKNVWVMGGAQIFGAFLGFVLTVLAGTFFSLLGALPVAAVFIWLILRKPAETQPVQVDAVDEKPTDDSVKDAESSSENQTTGD